VKGTRVGVLTQDADIQSDLTIQQELERVFEPVREMERKLRDLEAEMAEKHDDPVLFALASVSTYHHFMMETGGYRQFFLDALKYDFIFNYLSKIPNTLAENLVRRYFIQDADRETVALRSQYLPYMLGRTLILKKEQGYFNGISSDEVAFLICREALKAHVPEEEIRERLPEGMRIAEEICAMLPDRPSMQTIEEAVRTEL